MSAGALYIGGAAVAGCGGEESDGSEAAGGGPPAPQTNEEVPAEQRPSEVTLAEILANPAAGGGLDPWHLAVLACSRRP